MILRKVLESNWEVQLFLQPVNTLRASLFPVSSLVDAKFLFRFHVNTQGVYCEAPSNAFVKSVFTLIHLAVKKIRSEITTICISKMVTKNKNQHAQVFYFQNCDVQKSAPPLPPLFTAATLMYL